MGNEIQPEVAGKLNSLQETKADTSFVVEELRRKAEIVYVDKLRKDVDKKWAAKEKEDEEWKFDWYKVLEIAIVTQALTAFKLELPPLLNTEVLGDTLLGRFGITRNKWGVLWRGKSDTDTLFKSVERLQVMTTGAHEKIHHSNRRINALETKVGRAGSASRTTRSEIQRAARPGASGSELDQLARLERHVAALAQALG
ncbi:hypothetical protein [Streptomyces sp. NPDC059142]|uniref:hypothetical protein n=1 Tax=Streptomyces sp. NPDC059142 TaxID=3346739 RepID=UPI0036CA8FDD